MSPEDIIDLYTLNYQAASLYEQQIKAKKEIHISATGNCRNCETKVQPGIKFCSSECQEDYVYYHDRKRINSL